MWPREPQSAGEIPHEYRNEGMLVLMDDNPGLEASLCEGMLNLADVIDVVTGGDPEKERLLGGVILMVANRSYAAAKWHAQGQSSGRRR